MEVDGVTVGHMAQHPYTDLAPTDAAVAIRGFERRFRQAVNAPRPDDVGDEAFEGLDADVDPEEMVNRVGQQGRSALDHVALAAGRLELAASEVQAALVTDTHKVDHSLAEIEVVHTPSHSGHLEGELERLGKAADKLAHTIEHSDGSWWLLPRHTDNGGTATALELVQATVAFTLDRMHAAQAVLREVRGRPR